MYNTESVFLGIEPNAGRKAFAYATLDNQLKLINLSDCDLEEMTLILSGHKAAMVAINSPSSVNHGLVRMKLKDEMINPHQIRGADMRLAEYELRKLGIPVSGTPAHVEYCPAWMQSGFELYKSLKEMGYKTIASETTDLRWVETNPHASYHALIGRNPFPKPTLEGRLQRQLVLHDCGVHIRDPMEFFEEITRHKLINGILPLDLIYLPEYLDALVAAYVAWLCAHDFDSIQKLGSEVEGEIFLPATRTQTEGTIFEKF